MEIPPKEFNPVDKVIPGKGSKNIVIKEKNKK